MLWVAKIVQHDFFRVLDREGGKGKGGKRRGGICVR